MVGDGAGVVAARRVETERARQTPVHAVAAARPVDSACCRAGRRERANVPVPGDAIGRGQLIQVALERRPVVRDAVRRRVATHEVVNVCGLTENVLNVRGDGAARVEARAQLRGRVREVADELVDVVLGARAVVAAAVERVVEVVAEAIGLVRDASQETVNLLVAYAIGLARSRRVAVCGRAVGRAGLRPIPSDVVSPRERVEVCAHERPIALHARAHAVVEQEAVDE